LRLDRRHYRVKYFTSFAWSGFPRVHLTQVDQRHRAGRLGPAGAASDHDECRDGNPEATAACHVPIYSWLPVEKFLLPDFHHGLRDEIL
jgi:hypothetical protein